MGELAHHRPQELQLHIVGDAENKGENSPHPTSIINNNQATITPQTKNFWWWIRVALCSFFVLSGQSVGSLLGRLYYNKGGNSKWLVTLVPLVGFPILLLLYLIPTTRNPSNPHMETRPHPHPQAQSHSQSPSLKRLALVALFSFFLNAQKFTPFITNSLVLLTISSTLLACQSNLEDTKGVSKAKYALGFVCTIGASVAYGLLLSLTQSLVASVIIMVGLFESGEWKHLGREMNGYELGKVSYVMNLVGIAVAWQVFRIGMMGLILDVSSLFSNSISAVGLPIVPIFAAAFFGERMDGVKVMAMILAIWGFASYVYQHYLDDAQLKFQRNSVSGDEVSVRSPPNASTARVVDD
ncbi:hypothetical protein ACJRO7_017074 [Eucalyptus globulus]|uniref:Probable purine permease n=1 Tax=Eucalyptus globulus TaxID=34317 RepID=A0ABD3KP56_EUCGL